MIYYDLPRSVNSQSYECRFRPIRQDSLNPFSYRYLSSSETIVCYIVLINIPHSLKRLTRYVPKIVPPIVRIPEKSRGSINPFILALDQTRRTVPEIPVNPQHRSGIAHIRLFQQREWQNSAPGNRLRL